MRLLILGGTEFVGRAFTEAALSRGWEVTVFHRGHHAPPPGVRALRGDRTTEDGLAELAAAAASPEGGWDLVVDTWRFAPTAVRDAARLLAGRAGHYVYVSSRSVYGYPTGVDLDERCPVVDGDPDDPEGDYARLKRGGELAALASFGERALLVRAGLVLGPGENVGRLPWWLNRIARGGPVLAPGPRELTIQYIDARDLAGWSLDAAERGLGGVFNLVCPPDRTTMGDLLETCVAATGSTAELRWTDPEVLLAAGVEPWTQLPIWIPPGELHATMHRGNVGKALAAGLRCRPLSETVADTWAWQRELPGGVPSGTGHSASGISAELERELLGQP
ncbi:2'-hydroxyisoflavone reductase [Kitasatospora sp. GAS204A]|uniref:NAD-dependent epimerase/dehydratase family protein n=1 Tax=unclassified Kitasatospora TaxID=2633591 RepID=UPI00247637FF|nr:NAD-dependent epimerase/dehydratase family protein [Kitasatospora sp. GAS204B]MDH6118400.1 2'-hydroxyisoflavone reductase [Kitasatospora sp. GAS204B]